MTTIRLVKLNYFNGEESFIKFATWPEKYNFLQFRGNHRYITARKNLGLFFADWCIIDDDGNICEIDENTTFEDIKTLFPNTPIQFYINAFSCSTQFCWECKVSLYYNFYKKEKTKEYLCDPCFRNIEFSDNWTFTPYSKEIFKKFQIKKCAESKEEKEEPIAANVVANEIENREFVNNALQSLLAKSKSLKIAIQNAVVAFSQIVNEESNLKVNPTQMIMQNVFEEGFKEGKNGFISEMSIMNETQKGFQEAFLEYQKTQNLAVQKISESFYSYVQAAEKNSKKTEKIGDILQIIESLSTSIKQLPEENANKSVPEEHTNGSATKEHVNKSTAEEINEAEYNKSVVEETLDSVETSHSNQSDDSDLSKSFEKL